MIRKAIAVVCCMMYALSLKQCSLPWMSQNGDFREEVEVKTIQPSFMELGDELKQLGISEISEEKLAQMDADWAQLPAEFQDSMEKLPQLLSTIGMGDYDYDTWEWIPTSKSIYSFDVEVFDCSQMYTNFLRGIAAISNEEFTISDVVEDTSQVDVEKGTGKQKIQFKYNQNPYTYEAKAMNDWFDTNMIAFMNQVLEQEGNPKRLCVMGDGYQFCIIFYCTADWAEQFAKTTGYTLECDMQ